MGKLGLAILLVLASMGLMSMLLIPTTGGLTPLETIAFFLIGVIIGLYLFREKE